MHGPSLVLVLLWQIALILTVSRLVGAVFRRFKQPQVVGEMAAGIMLGPSLFGLLAPDAVAAVFPRATLSYLNLFSQVGIILFLFLIGLELDPKLLRRRGHAAVVIGQVSIIWPFLLGAALTLFLYPRLFNDASAMRFVAVALFMGAAMSITAFPVLARILTERKLHRTPVGAITVTCAAVNDVTAWCMLAFVVGISRATGLGPAVMTAALACVYVCGMFFAVRPLLRRLEVYRQQQGRLTREILALILALVLGSAMLTEVIGIHALFGAFLCGAMMPKDDAFVRQLSEKLEDFTVVFLLPIFFAYAGLRTHIGLLNNGELWLYAALVIAVASLGKFGGSTVAARLCGLGWRESSAIGILMNTRGLMELVILNIGREMGVITDAVFAMMVLMALVTTALTTPVLQWIYPERLFAAAPAVEAAEPPRARPVLVSIARPENAPAMIALGQMLAGDGSRLLALHLRPPVDRDAYRSAADGEDLGHDEFLDRILNRARASPVAQGEGSEFAAAGSGAPFVPSGPARRRRASVPSPQIEPLSLVSSDAVADIVEVARSREPDLLIIGHHKPVFGRRMLGGTVHRVLTGAPVDVGVYIERGSPRKRRSDEGTKRRREEQMGPIPSFVAPSLRGSVASPEQVLVPFLGSPHDRLALQLAQRLARNVGSTVTIIHVVPTLRGQGTRLGAAEETNRVFRDPSQPTPVTFRVIPDDSPVDVVIREAIAFDLVIIGVAKEWGLESDLFGWRPERIARDCPCSMLITRKHGVERENG